MTQYSNLQDPVDPQVEEKIFTLLQQDLNSFYKTKDVETQTRDLWTKRLANARFLFENDDQINKHYFRNFRSIRKRLIADTPYAKNPLSKIMYRGDLQFAQMQFDKIFKGGALNADEMRASLNRHKFDLIGNPGYLEKDNFIYSERYLRHCHYMNLFRKMLSREMGRQNYIMFDIGGGYGIFDKFILTSFPGIKPVIVDLPEQLFNASYYLRCNFPDLRVNFISEAENREVYDESFFEQYDICLLPANKFDAVTLKKNVFIVNFNSFGEMSREIFEAYKSSTAFKNLDYLFTLNRIDSFPTYTNGISILDYELESYDKIHLEISPLFDYYVGRKFYFMTEIRSFSSRCFEFIGKALS